MEKRRDNLATAALCRFCLSGDAQLTNIYDRNVQRKGHHLTKSPNLPMRILMSISVECFPSDKMPIYICNRCMFFMDIVYKFKSICREADNLTTQFLHVGSPLEPMKWNPSLVKLFNTVQKQNPEVEVLKIKGGPTVQVSQDGSDSEDEDEDVYNVRIGDGTQGGTSACVKVVTKEEPAKGKKKSEHGLSHYFKKEVEEAIVEIDSADAAKDGDPLALEEPKVSPKPAEGSWDCDECNNSYPLQQLLELHKMQKHRARNVACDICETKFFSKYDLESHMLRHNQDVQFQCVACDKNFKRDVLLRRHERAVHPKLLQYKCSACPASFIEKEDIVAHMDRHHRPTTRERKYQCSICSKKFFDKYSLTRHQLVVHSVKTSLACEYCPERFNSVTRLTRHVRSHAGEKAYPCKFCNKRFTKSHHCTRHMRLKHSDLVSSEDYRCEQCTATFVNQDDLIYHSACHATVNCICPLCQEKFSDVDAVTAHIKTHVASNEFMCDYCELVFTSNEKLDSHVAAAHADEITGSIGSQHEDDSMEMEGDDDYDAIEVKEDGDQMIVEIKKPNSFMKITQAAEDKNNYTNSEESEPESPHTEPHLRAPERQPVSAAKQLPQLPSLTPAPTLSPVSTKVHTIRDIAMATIAQKSVEVKRKMIQQVSEHVPEKKVEKPKVETDKSLRLLEKELQELQRTNKREEPPKTSAKPMETLRNRRAQVHTSTPKLRSAEDKKTPVQAKTTPVEKKTTAEKRGVKENKRPEETKQTKTINVEEDKEAKSKEEKDTKVKEDKDTKVKEDKDTKVKEDKDTKVKEDSKSKEDKEVKNKEEKESKYIFSKEESKDKSVMKNGTTTKTPDEGVRRSSRASKVKDYAKMVQSKTSTTHSDDDSDDSDDEEYMESEKSEGRQKRKGSQKQTPKAAPVAKAASPAAAAAAAATPARKRGRPRKNPVDADVPTKVKKGDASITEANTSQDEKMEVDESTSKESQRSQPPEEAKQPEKEAEKAEETSKTDTLKLTSKPKPISPPVPPTAALKKVPIRALPPGVKPLPLPIGARPMGPSEISEMQIGKKVVKVQKIVMTKAEVEAMAKKGLLEMKDGTMVLKAGVKLADSTLKSIVAEVAENAAKESLPKAAPTRCELDA